MIQFLSRLWVVGMIILVAGTSSMGVQSELYPVDESELIEVCADGVVYVPPGTKYVRCNGKVMKVLRIERGAYRDGENCRCPHCCDGICYIIVACDPLPQDILDGVERDCGTGELTFSDPDVQGLLCTMYIGC